MKTQIDKLAKAIPTMFLAMLLVAACGNSGGADEAPDQEDSDDGQPVENVPLEYSLSGLRESDPLEVTILVILPEGGTEQSVESVTDGTHTAQIQPPVDSLINVFLSEPTNPDLRCVNTLPNGTGRIISGGTAQFEITCFYAWENVRVLVDGVEGTGLLRFSYITESGATIWTDPLDRNGTLTIPVPPGINAVTENDTLFLGILPPEDQECTAHPLNGIVIADEIPVFDVSCRGEERPIPYTVTGLRGMGGELTLNVTNEDGSIELSSYALERDGAFETEPVKQNAEYQMQVNAQPTSPDQTCVVDPATPSVLTTDDPDPIVVSCPSLHRAYSLERAAIQGQGPNSEIVLEGEQFGGVVEVQQSFDSAGFMDDLVELAAGLEQTELFTDYLNQQSPQGVIFSNETGFTYWLAAQSPKFQQAPGKAITHNADLTTTWRFRKVAGDASVTFVISRLRLLNLWLEHQANFGRLVAIADIAFRGYVGPDPLNAEEDERNIFFDAGGVVSLIGTADESPGGAGEVAWAKTVETNGETEIWSDANFEFNPAAGVGPYAGTPHWLASINLQDPIRVQIALSSLPVGALFEVVSVAHVSARNGLSREGHTVAYLRDPGGFDPGDPEAGAARLEVKGVETLAVDQDVLDAIAAAEFGETELCSGSGLSTLSFDVSDITLNENFELGPHASLRVTRSGSATGLATARIASIPGTAEATDYDPTPIEVRFAADNVQPRTIKVPIVDDDLVEADETFVLRLENPGGCAVIGAENTVSVTIVSEDVEPSSATFSATDFLVSESAGAAEITFVRTGPSDPQVNVDFRTADGTATQADYTPVDTFVVFPAGDASEQTVPVPVIDNSTADGDRTVELSLWTRGDDPELLDTATLVIDDDES